jgi:glycine/D-amino acid oxidase-like deaminating enzyme
MSDPNATPPSIRRILVVGVGRMGGGLARNLARHGSFEVTVFDRSEEAVARCVEAGATAATSVVDAAGDADPVVPSLPMPADVVGLVEEVVPHLQPHALVMDTSTIDPATAGRATQTLVSLLASFVAADVDGRLDNLDPVRRFEQASPLLGRDITRALDTPTLACAQSLLSIARRELSGPVTAATAAAFGAVQATIDRARATTQP